MVLKTREKEQNDNHVEETISSKKKVCNHKKAAKCDLLSTEDSNSIMIGIKVYILRQKSVMIDVITDTPHQLAFY